MRSYRMGRINKEFQRSISDLLQLRIKKEHVSEAIITAVDVSSDLGYAKVYYTLLDEHVRGTVQKALESVAGQLRGILGREMHLRTIPQLTFVYDNSEAEARKMDELLDRVAKLDAEIIKSSETKSEENED